MTNSIGLYLHIPFCVRKCAYCDFYSTFLNHELLGAYTDALIKDINKWGGKLNRPISSIYLGGGTPSLLGEQLPAVLEAVNKSFVVKEDAEITLEINPAQDSKSILSLAKSVGVNRISIGAQSGDDSELKLLGRTHTTKDTAETFEVARKLCFDNISMDIMLALPSSSCASLEKSLDFITAFSPEHISAYLLKIEQNTLFHKIEKELCLPDDDSQAQQYTFMCDYLKSKGYLHYEISNFSKPEKESRHNLIYWKCKEYLGLGASAHSFIDGERFFYPNDLKGYIKGISPVFDSLGGDESEYIMLNLRLSDGLLFKDFSQKFGKEIPSSLLQKAKLLERAKLLNISEQSIALTEKGMLVSNNIIQNLLEEVI